MKSKTDIEIKTEKEKLQTKEDPKNKTYTSSKFAQEADKHINLIEENSQENEEDKSDKENFKNDGVSRNGFSLYDGDSPSNKSLQEINDKLSRLETQLAINPDGQNMDAITEHSKEHKSKTESSLSIESQISKMILDSHPSQKHKKLETKNENMVSRMENKTSNEIVTQKNDWMLSNANINFTRYTDKPAETILEDSGSININSAVDVDDVCSLIDITDVLHNDASKNALANKWKSMKKLQKDISK